MVASGKEYLQEVRDSILSEQTFVRAVLSGRIRGTENRWQRVVVRPVRVKGKRRLQISCFDDRRDVTRNYDPGEAATRVDDLLALPFRNLFVESTVGQLQVQISRKGKAHVHRKVLEDKRGPPELEHDRHKNLLLPVGEPDSYLHAIGVMDRDGKVRPRMRRKFRQINEFLRLLVETGAVERAASAPTGALQIVDCGCGNAYLSFAVYHYLEHVLEVPTRLVGVDVNLELVDRRARLAARLGWTGLAFGSARIVDYEPETSPDIVLALHACDTATDEALAQGVAWEAKTMLSVPCCHHHLQAQLDDTPEWMRPIYRHGILRERLGDVLTDALRAQLLRQAGYRTDVIQFVSPEHTDKNLMIRAVRSGAPVPDEYRRLKEAFGVTPYLERLMSSKAGTE